MSKTKLSYALLVIFAAVPSFAQVVSASGGNPMTIQEYTNREADIKRAELDAKFNEARQKGNPAAAPVAAPTARTCGDDLSMFAVYGIGRNLRADFGYQGATITAAPGDRADMGGWSVEELTPTRAMMVKRHGKKVTRCPLYLSSGVRDFTPQAISPASADAQVVVPAISVIPSSAASAGKAAAAVGSAK